MGIIPLDSACWDCFFGGCAGLHRQAGGTGAETGGQMQGVHEVAYLEKGYYTSYTSPDGAALRDHSRVNSSLQ